MTSRIFISILCTVFIHGLTEAAGGQLYRPSNSRPIPTFGTNRDILNLKQTVSSLQRELVAARRNNHEMEDTIKLMNYTLFSLVADISASHEAKVDELTERLEVAEDNIETIVDQAGIDLEETQLHDFLGNAEAQLIDLEMDPSFDPAEVPTIPTELEDIPVDQADLLGGALYSINKQNQKLANQVVALQQELESGATSSQRQQNDILENKVNQIERLIVSQNHRTIGKGSRGGVHAGGRTAAAGSFGVQSGPLSEEEQQAMEEILDDVRGGVVSLFSAARTSSFIGTKGVPHPVPYEVQLATKGGVFHMSNGTFTCSISGYYFITFTSRSYDHKYLGINLMKNDQSLTAIFSDKHGRNVMQTQSIIIHLAEGDNLWLRMPPSDKFALHSDAYHLSTFTGFLLYQGDP